MSEPLSELAFFVAIERAKVEAKIAVLEEMEQQVSYIEPADCEAVYIEVVQRKIAALRKELEG